MQDLEDFSTAHTGGELSGYVSALNVANLLRFAFFFDPNIEKCQF